MGKRDTREWDGINIDRANAIAEILLDLLNGHYGVENKIKREIVYNLVIQALDKEIVKRTFRRYVEYLQTHDQRCANIVSTNKDGGGYFLACSLDEFRKETANRVNQYISMLINLKMQLKLFGVNVSGFEQMKFDFADFYSIDRELLGDLNSGLQEQINADGKPVIGIKTTEGRTAFDSDSVNVRQTAG